MISWTDTHLDTHPVIFDVRADSDDLASARVIGVFHEGVWTYESREALDERIERIVADNAAAAASGNVERIAAAKANLDRIGIIRAGAVFDAARCKYLADTILAEHRLKNEAHAAICAALPRSMQKELLDSDGDPTGEWVVKDKHAPVWSYGAVDGKLSFTVPGAGAKVLKAIRGALAGYGDAVTVG